MTEERLVDVTIKVSVHDNASGYFLGTTEVSIDGEDENAEGTVEFLRDIIRVYCKRSGYERKIGV